MASIHVSEATLAAMRAAFPHEKANASKLCVLSVISHVPMPQEISEFTARLLLPFSVRTQTATQSPTALDADPGGFHIKRWALYQDLYFCTPELLPENDTAVMAEIGSFFFYRFSSDSSWDPYWDPWRKWSVWERKVFKQIMDSMMKRMSGSQDDARVHVQAQVLSETSRSQEQMLIFLMHQGMSMRELGMWRGAEMVRELPGPHWETN